MTLKVKLLIVNIQQFEEQFPICNGWDCGLRRWLPPLVMTFTDTQA